MLYLVLEILQKNDRHKLSHWHQHSPGVSTVTATCATVRLVGRQRERKQVVLQWCRGGCPKWDRGSDAHPWDRGKTKVSKLTTYVKLIGMHTLWCLETANCLQQPDLNHHQQHTCCSLDRFLRQQQVEIRKGGLSNIPYNDLLDDWSRYYLYYMEVLKCHMLSYSTAHLSFYTDIRYTVYVTVIRSMTSRMFNKVLLLLPLLLPSSYRSISVQMGP